MTINEYQQRAMASLNPELKGRDVLINSVMGLCGESGEAIDIVKKVAGPGPSAGPGASGQGAGGRGLVSGRGGHGAGP